MFCQVCQGVHLFRWVSLFESLEYVESKFSEKDVILEEQKLIIRQKEGVDTKSMVEIFCQAISFALLAAKM